MTNWLRPSLFAMLVTGLLVGCVEEIPIDDSLATDYLFVDGSVTRGETTHTLQLGRSQGPGLESFTPVEVEAVELEELSTGRRYAYRQAPDPGEYELNGVPIGDGAYRLRIRFPGGREITSVPDSLTGSPLGVTGLGRVLRRVNIGSDSTPVAATAALRIELPATSPLGVLVLRHQFTYQLTDLACGPFDNALVCYFVEVPKVNELSIVDLTRFEPGTTIPLDVGNVAFTYRLAETSYINVTLDRYSAAATAYFAAVEATLRTQDGFFSGRPQTLAGNLDFEDRDQSRAREVIGYFGVRERYVVNAALSDPDIKVLAGPAACSGAIDGPNARECCNCTVIDQPRIQRPEYW